MRPLARKALRITRGDVERAADWAFNNWDTPIDDEDDGAPDTGTTIVVHTLTLKFDLTITCIYV